MTFNLPKTRHPNHFGGGQHLSISYVSATVTARGHVSNFGSFKAISDGLLAISSYFVQQQASASAQPQPSVQNPPVYPPTHTQPSVTTSATLSTPSASNSSTTTNVTQSGTYYNSASILQPGQSTGNQNVPSSGFYTVPSNNGPNAGFPNTGISVSSNVPNQGFLNQNTNGLNAPMPVSPVQDDNYNPRQVISIGLPLGYGVDEKIKQLIWQDKYVELSLLTNADQNDDYDLQFNPKMGSIQFKQKQKSIKSIVHWCDIMYTYQAIMMEDEVRAKDVPLFLNYIKDVRGICEEGWG